RSDTPRPASHRPPTTAAPCPSPRRARRAPQAAASCVPRRSTPSSPSRPPTAVSPSARAEYTTVVRQFAAVWAKKAAAVRARSAQPTGQRPELRPRQPRPPRIPELLHRRPQRHPDPCRDLVLRLGVRQVAPHGEGPAENLPVVP